MFFKGNSSSTLETYYNCLPTRRQVLAYLFHFIRVENQNLHQSSVAVTTELLNQWRNKHIPTKYVAGITIKIKRLYNEHHNIESLLKRDTTTEASKRERYMTALDKLFDISHQDAQNLIKDNNIKIYLRDQQQGIRPNRATESNPDLAKQDAHESNEHELNSSFMGKLSVSDANKNISSSQSRSSYSTMSAGTNTQVSSGSESRSSHSTMSAGTNTQASSGSEYLPPAIKKAKLNVNQRLNVLTSDVLSALDRSSVSNANALYIISSVLTAVGLEINDFALSKETIRQARIKNRKIIADEIKNTFNGTDTVFTVHWDGKMLPDLMSTEMCDRLAVLVSGKDKIKLLGVPKIDRGTGENQANVIIDTLTDWGILNNVRAMCFDTTSVNTGHNNGTCTLLETKLERRLLYFACRHHVLEILASKVFKSVVEPNTSGPEILLFKRFKNNWSNIDITNYKSGIEEEKINMVFDNNTKKEIITFINKQLGTLPADRVDYTQFLYLALFFLGEKPTNSSGKFISIQKPGALSRARWMSTILYSLKVFMFRHQFSLKSKNIPKLFSLFI